MMQNFHVMFKSHDNKKIFHREEDCLVYLQLVKRACEKYGMRWLVYAIMSNHIHLVLCGNGEDLPHVRYNISSGYAAYYRRTYPCYCAPGKPVFRSHNATKWLQANNDLKQVIRYVNRNLIEKSLEDKLGDSPRGSYRAILSARLPEDGENPFYTCDALREIQDALDADAVFRAFGKNHKEQLQNFIAFHKVASKDPQDDRKSTATVISQELQKAEEILQTYYCSNYLYRNKPYDAQTRQAFLDWVGRRGNPTKVQLIRDVANSTSLTSRQIADFLKVGRTTVQEALKSQKGKAP